MTCSDDDMTFNKAVTQINAFYGTGPFPLVDNGDAGDPGQSGGIRLFGLPSDTGLPFSVATIPSRHMSYLLRSQGANLNTLGGSPSTVLTMQTSQALVQANCVTSNLYDFDHNSTYVAFDESGAQLNNFVTWGECLQNPTADGDIVFFTNLPHSAPSRHSTLMLFGTTAVSLP